MIGRNYFNPLLLWCFLPSFCQVFRADTYVRASEVKKFITMLVVHGQPDRAFEGMGTPFATSKMKNMGVLNTTTRFHQFHRCVGTEDEKSHGMEGCLQ